MTTTSKDDALDLRNVSIKIANYKCFGPTHQGFDALPPFTIIIGQNNAGKSALADAISLAKSPNTMTTLRDGQAPELLIRAPMTRGELIRTFPRGEAGPIADRRRYAEGRVGDQITYTLNQRNQQRYVSTAAPQAELFQELFADLAAQKKNVLDPYLVRRLRAERDIRPEELSRTPRPGEHGTSVTATLLHFRTDERRDKGLVQQTMLNDLNRIVGPDLHFREIEILHHESDESWEVQLYGDHHERVPLSRSGSGIKTILLVLTYLHLLPVLDEAKSWQYIYIFEELENNLHPAVQRRLLRYLHEFAAERECRFVLTTHSPVEIDFFARDAASQVIHVRSASEQSIATTIGGYAEGCSILRDLDLRASDLLQANGIIWVEGPSDRIYVNRWIALASDEQLQEGVHYQILQYGGSLIAHLDGEDPTISRETIHLLTVNRNAAILIDSDRRHPTDQLKVHAQRLRDELAQHNGFTWITAGRTIENYLPGRFFGGKSPQQYDDVIAKIANTKHTPTELKLPSDKVRLARKITPGLKTADLDVLDLATQVNALCTLVKKWSSMPTD